MEFSWLFLTIASDVFPYIFLQYLPFKENLKYGYFKSIGISALVLLFWFIPFPFLAHRIWFNPNIMVLYRISLLIPLCCMTIFLVKGNLYKNLFVFFLMLPYVLSTLVTSSFLANFVRLNNISPYMLIGIVRIVIAGLSFPLVLWLLKQFLIPMLTLNDDEIWQIALPIPITYNLISIFLINSKYSTSGATFIYVLQHFLIMLCCILTCLLVTKALQRTHDNAELLQREKHSKRLLELQSQQYHSIVENIEETARSRHDLRHQILLIQSFVNANDLNGLNNYLSQYSHSLPLQTPIQNYCDNNTINVILSHYIDIAKENQTEVELDLNLQEISKVDHIDLCVLFGNLMENAIESCKRISSARTIKLKSQILAGRFSIITINTYDTIVQSKNGHYLSRKRKFQSEGVGLSTIEAIVTKYNGELRIKEEGNYFVVSLYLQLN